MMVVPALDLQAQYYDLNEELDAAILRVLQSGQYILGPEVRALEAEIATLCGVDHAVGVASGTDALLLALLALGIGPGDEVITTPFSFVATAAAISRTGARPVFADIDPITYNLNPDAVEAALTDRTAAILPVHLYGQPAEMGRLCDIATEQGLVVIEDACQAIGAMYDGRMVGSLGDVAALSFYPTKNLGGAGDGGMVLTEDTPLAGRVDTLRRQGSRQKYIATELGLNSRLDEIQAAILRVKLLHLTAWNEGRRKIAALYTEGLYGLPVQPPAHLLQTQPVYHQYTLRCRDRDGLLEHLRKCEVGAQVYYPVPIHRQPLYAGECRDVHCPVAEKASREVLSLPIYPEMDGDDIEFVIDAVRGYYG